MGIERYTNLVSFTAALFCFKVFLTADAVYIKTVKRYMSHFNFADEWDS